ncbi:hypothetical protein Sinac_1425 [Singulisphaera acidiphila DSM 18658]|uniref:Uncharacterized protein n=1 Tax=Singulisphaera acidiphila (strain ATCC BAA-1392 / DSM 18658 / VKM B-2454 / MOB10) TaxID=886293 RepID=L0D982_SINAD|nr:hypothetical protein Sinac_1425 [Singulisphaera acidiphila DSM 18658]
MPATVLGVVASDYFLIEPRVARAYENSSRWVPSRSRTNSQRIDARFGKVMYMFCGSRRATTQSLSPRRVKLCRTRFPRLRRDWL